MGLFSWLWNMARAWPNPGMGLRFGSPRAVLLQFLILFFTLFFIVMALMGFNVSDVEAWLDAHGGLFDTIGTVLFKMLLVFILLICVVTVAGAIFDRKNPGRPGLWQAAFSVLVGYVAWVGIWM